MADDFKIKKIAEIRNGFSEKFGIPKQSGLCSSIKSQIILEPEYRNPDAFRGLEMFSHIWIIWQFSKSVRDDWSPTVRPPRLGGNKKLGVFATRSPFRPNPLGLSCVKLDKIEFDEKLGPVLHVSGADLMNKTPIYDIKPYLPYADCIPDATEGFTVVEKITLDVEFKSEILNDIDKSFLTEIENILSQDPRPAYQNDPERIYKMQYGGYDIAFYVENQKLTVTEMEKL